MFGSSRYHKEFETTTFSPCSIYAISKNIFSFHTVKYYRDAYKIHACNGIKLKNCQIIMNPFPALKSSTRS